jgi:hypothetical protein
MQKNNVNESLDNLGNFQTNKDQTLGSVIARAAFLISQGAHLQVPPAKPLIVDDTATKYSNKRSARRSGDKPLTP